MMEIVILSGKGGTGKTSLTAAFAALAGRAVLADCDVDAADLHMVLAPAETEVHAYRAGSTARIDPRQCGACGLCAYLCRFEAVVREEPPSAGWRVDPLACEGCGVCAHFCPRKAIEMEEVVSGSWFRSETRFGPMLHAQLGVGAENSGKLVTLLRREARELAAVRDIDLLLSDGPPGIGCPVIASLTGADHAVFVTEPTVSGIHDLERVAKLAAGFRLPGSVVVNKADIDRERADEIAGFARDHGLTLLGSIPYDPAFTRAQMQGQSVVEMDDGRASQAVRAVWDRLSGALSTHRPQLRTMPAPILR